MDQLRRHARQLKGYRTAIVMAITPHPGDSATVEDISHASGVRFLHVPWRRVWTWANARLEQRSSGVPEFLLHQFLSLLQEEERMTDFQGMRFLDGYDYAQAKTILAKLRDELIKRAPKEFRKYKHGRGKISDDGRSVWDVLSKTPDHTHSIHITIGINERGTGEVSLTLPKAVKGGIWSSFSDSIARESFADTLLKRLLALRKGRCNTVRLSFTQRHKDRGHRSGPWVQDGDLKFNVDTYRGENWVKQSPSWWAAFRKIAGSPRRGANREMQINVEWSPERARRPAFVEDAIHTMRGFGPIARMLSPR